MALTLTQHLWWTLTQHHYGPNPNTTPLDDPNKSLYGSNPNTTLYGHNPNTALYGPNPTPTPNLIAPTLSVPNGPNSTTNPDRIPIPDRMEALISHFPGVTFFSWGGFIFLTCFFISSCFLSRKTSYKRIVLYV